MQNSQQQVTAPRYAVITPARNEAAYIEKALESMTRQTLKPVAWVIVNDGSSDETGPIVERWTKDYPWIHLINRADRGKRQRGKGVVETFYAGFSTLSEPFDFIVKLDGDVSFQDDYFEGLLCKFALNPRLGIAGGGLHEQPDGKTWILNSTRDVVRGATKIYRRECFNEIGGLAPTMGWDGIDEWTAHSLGWEVESFTEYKLYHYRYTGAASGKVNNWVEQGRAAYFIGYHPLYLLARAVRCCTEKPYIISGLALAYSYFASTIRRDPQYDRPSVIRYVRKTQLRKLVGLAAGKPIHDAVKNP